jgi:23S rRNA pseudouridine1911/1915/1917 synthase
VAEAGVRLIDHLRALGLNGRTARAALNTGKIWYYDAPTADPGRDVLGEHVRYLPNAPRITVGRDPAVIYRDSHVVIVWKPAGLLSVPADGRRREPNLIGVVADTLHQQLFAVHRLDQMTSGLMAMATTPTAQARLRDMFAAHRIERRYLAIVRDNFAVKPITVRSRIVRNRGDGLRGSREADDDATARQAVTHFSLVEQLGPSAALVEARLETGRTHQVRIHLAEMGHPVLGDGLYGGQALGRMMPRFALHAWVLGFHQPMTAAELRFAAPLPDDLEKYARRLKAQRPTPGIGQSAPTQR